MQQLELLSGMKKRWGSCHNVLVVVIPSWKEVENSSFGSLLGLSLAPNSCAGKAPKACSGLQPVPSTGVWRLRR